jgi:hypothetical protein
VIATVLLRVFLDCNVGEMHEHVVHLGDVGGVELVAETAKTFIVDICAYGPVTGDQD